MAGGLEEFALQVSLLELLIEIAILPLEQRAVLAEAPDLIAERGDDPQRIWCFHVKR